MKKIFLLCLIIPIVLHLQSVTIQAQSKVDAPSVLYHNEIKGDVHLIVGYTYKSTPSTSPFLKKVDIVQTGEIRRDIKFYSNNTSTEEWRSGNTRFASPTGNSDVIIVNYVTDDNQGYHDAVDFTELSWITKESFRGIKEHENKKCYIYQLDDLSALIDETTLNPVAFESKSMSVAYTYSNATEKSLQLPEKYLKKIQQNRRANAGGPIE
ncbi:MAG: hypothetical protein LBH01_07300 [Verrucomicrobiales bacterium]|jgi:hypothetical protein|nr:hypothetical protein [Verrucomicrobiales bacterium]